MVRWEVKRLPLTAEKQPTGGGDDVKYIIMDDFTAVFVDNSSVIHDSEVLCWR